MSLLDFLTTGQLGPIRLGMWATDVTEVLGLPDDMGDIGDFNEDLGDIENHPYGTMVTYGPLHLAFIDGELWYYILDVNESSGDLPQALGITWLNNLRNMDRATFANYLRENGITGREFDTDEDDGIALRVIIGNAIMVLFNLSDGKDEILSLHRSVPISQAASLPLWEYAG